MSCDSLSLRQALSLYRWLCWLMLYPYGSAIRLTGCPAGACGSPDAIHPSRVGGEIPTHLPLRDRWMAFGCLGLIGCGRDASWHVAGLSVCIGPLTNWTAGASWHLSSVLVSPEPCGYQSPSSGRAAPCVACSGQWLRPIRSARLMALKPRKQKPRSCLGVGASCLEAITPPLGS